MNEQYLAQIKANEQEILKNNPPKELKRCPKCKRNHEKFRLHALRERIFLLIVGSLVQEVRSFLGRFMCGLCQGSFTCYPAYALPYKRYLRPQIQEKSQEYVQESAKTYEEVASYEKGPIFHEKSAKSSEQEMAKPQSPAKQEKEFAKSSVWRWLSFFGKQQENLTRALDLIRQKNPQTKLLRHVYGIAPRKYKSQSRKGLLQTAAWFLDAMKELSGVFGECEKFTEFATGFF